MVFKPVRKGQSQIQKGQRQEKEALLERKETTKNEKPTEGDPMSDYITPPENQGQIVIVSYASDGEGVFRRTVDQSGKRPTLHEHIYWEDFLDHEPEYQPWNRAPRIPDDAWSESSPWRSGTEPLSGWYPNPECEQ